MFGDVAGNYVNKAMDDCTGREILDELLGHLGFGDIADEVRRTTKVTTVQMPYIDAQFERRAIEDRPLVVRLKKAGSVIRDGDSDPAVHQETGWWVDQPEMVQPGDRTISEAQLRG
ncbi:oleate hydratase [Devosia sp. ZB163]|uniref:oleate hydratase n=1 Tax=Devosia sp. ZB163 TaxID=3025938 RepID=UPI002361D1CE|nr:oleate hydratase [Devosia sp. ZB163]MDC9823622.1 oleate hydratase [Devosia sp. ZB163]